MGTPKDRTLTHLARLTGLAVLAALVSACGGGGGSGPQAPSSSPPPAPAPPSGSSSGSPALRNNAPGAAARYDSFSSRLVTVPVDRQAFSGGRVFVKVSRDDGEVLFLGEVAPSIAFTIPVQLPAGSTRVDYQIFSESGRDPIVFGEVTP